MISHVDNPFKSPSVLSVCTGLRGIERGLKRAIKSEVRVAAYVEIEAFVIANLIAAMESGKLAPAPVWPDVKTFQAERFRGKLHGLIGGYPCQPFSQIGLGGVSMIHDTFTRISLELSKQADLFGASLKTSPTTCKLGSTQFTQTYNEWVSRLRQEFTRRQKWGQVTYENGCLSLQSKKKFWTTPSARDWKDTAGMSTVRNDARHRLDQLPRQVFFLHSLESHSTVGKNPVYLNPAWVAQMMGMTIQTIFYVPLVTASYPKQQN